MVAPLTHRDDSLAIRDRDAVSHYGAAAPDASRAIVRDPQMFQLRVVHIEICVGVEEVDPVLTPRATVPLCTRTLRTLMSAGVRIPDIEPARPVRLKPIRSMVTSLAAISMPDLPLWPAMFPVR
jgi:hypothetical protein